MASRASPEHRPRVIALAGPTASGKTAAALAIARERPVEIVSVDSALVYIGMDIGTAKPSAAERAAVPHHLIDIRDPTQAYSAAEFAAEARRLIDDIHARGASALLVGGTMLYFKALFEGLHEMPPADPAVRAAIDAQAQAEGWPALHAELARIDPITAARLAPHDAQRIQRALEVWRSTGRALSDHHAANKGAGISASNDSATLLSLEPRERAWLHQRIAQRFAQMIDDGLIEEVQSLRRRGDLHAGLPSMRCVGYRQAWEWLDAREAGDAPTMERLRDQGIFATRQLAKRQLTWLRGMPHREVIACDAPDALDQVLQKVKALP